MSDKARNIWVFLFTILTPWIVHSGPQDEVLQVLTDPISQFTNSLLIESGKSGRAPISLLKSEVGQAFASTPAVLQTINADRRLRAQLEGLEAQGLPQVSLSVSGGKQHFFREGPEGNVDTTTLEVSQKVYDFGSLSSAIEEKELANDSVRYDDRQKKADVASDLVNARIGLFLAERQWELAELNVELREKFSGFMDRRFELGSISNADLYRVQSQLAAARFQLPDAETDLAIARSRYEELYGITAPAGMLFEHPSFESNSDVNGLIISHPLYLSASNRLSAAKSRFDSIDSEKYGSFNLNGSWSSDESLASGRSIAAEARVIYRVSLFDGGGLDSRIDEAETAVIEATHELDRVERELRQQLNSSYTRLLNSVSKKVFASEHLRSTIQSSEAITKLYLYDRASLDDVLTIQNDLVRAAGDLIRATHDESIAYFDWLNTSGNINSVFESYL